MSDVREDAVAPLLHALGPGRKPLCGVFGFSSYHPDSATCPACKEKQKMTSPGEAVQHPSHYGGDVVHETIKCLKAWGLEKDALLWNATKYICRAGKKDPAKMIEDLNKALFYLNRRIADLEAQQQ